MKSALTAEGGWAKTIEFARSPFNAVKQGEKEVKTRKRNTLFNIRNQGFRTILNGGGSGVSPDNSNNSNGVFFFFGSLFLFASQSKRKSEQYHVKFLKIDNTSALIYNFYTCSNNKKGVRNGSTV